MAGLNQTEAKNCLRCEANFNSPYPDKLYCSNLCARKAQEHRYEQRTGHSRWHRRRDDRREFIYQAKLTSAGCRVCGEKRPNCLDFHHLDKNVKEFQLSDVCKRRNWSWAKIKLELAKCEILCSNCHRVLELGDGYAEADRPKD